MSSQWTDAEKARLYKAIEKATSRADAVIRAQKALPKRPLTLDGIERMLGREGKPTLSQYAAKNAPDHEPPAPKKLVEDHRLQNELKSLKSSHERLVAELHDRDEQISILKGMAGTKPLKPIVLPKGRGRDKQRRGTAVALCSDWHVEERVDPKTVNGLNFYDLALAEKCIDEMAEAIAWLTIDNRYDVRELVVALLGDLFSGYIHDELKETAQLSPVRASAWLLVRLEKFLRRIAALCPNVERFMIVCNDGNHGRLTQKMRAATRTANSLEWFVYFNLAERMRDDPRFEFQIADGVWNYLDVFGRTFGFCHGDTYRYLGGVGGLLIPVRRGLNEDRKYMAFGEQPRRVDHVSMGHFHTRMDLEDVSVNGSMIGISPYSMSIHAPPEARKQSWFLVDEKNGKCLSAPIWLPNK
jgi:hypothetical protein